MGAVRKERQPTSTASGKERSQTCPKTTGLAQKSKCVHASEACLHGKSPNFPDAEMIDADSASATNPGPENPRNSKQAQQASRLSKGKEVAQQELPIPADVSDNENIIEAEKQLAARNQSIISICIDAQNLVEAALSPLATGENKEFVDAPQVYLRAAIVQFSKTGLESKAPVPPAPPALPARSVFPPPPRVREQRVQIPGSPKDQAAKSTWATVARKGLKANPGPTKPKLAPSAPKPKEKNISTADKRLFVRLECDSEWRSLSLYGAKSAVTNSLSCSKDDIKLIQRVKTDFAITAKDDETRQRLLEKADGGIENFKLEQTSNLVALRIATVPVAIKYSSGVVSTTAQIVADEIFRVTGKVPTQLRPHSVTKSGAKYQNWQALFTRESAPRPGFRLFYESGMASTFRPRRPIEQCKRCLGYHPTRGVAPAPQHAGTADQRCTPRRSARPPSDAETAEDLTDRIAGIVWRDLRGPVR
ncbi:hypothetical protein K3495_g4104 [Podosphaera aphanis]|nr:hypothetical protein K3495_g4104 [Podosphaera aphanis]